MKDGKHEGFKVVDKRGGVEEVDDQQAEEQKVGTEMKALEGVEYAIMLLHRGNGLVEIEPDVTKFGVVADRQPQPHEVFAAISAARDTMLVNRVAMTSAGMVEGLLGKLMMMLTNPVGKGPRRQN